MYPMEITTDFQNYKEILSRVVNSEWLNETEMGTTVNSIAVSSTCQ